MYFISDFNVEMLARQVANSVLPSLETRSAPFGRVIEALAAGPPGPEWSAVVWSQPASIRGAICAVIPKSSHWKKRPIDVGKTSTGVPPSPNTSSSMSRPSAGLCNFR